MLGNEGVSTCVCRYWCLQAHMHMCDHAYSVYMSENGGVNACMCRCWCLQVHMHIYDQSCRGQRYQVSSSITLHFICILFYFMSKDIWPACMSVHPVFVCLEKSTRSPGTKVIDACEPPYRYWELNLGLLGEQTVLNTNHLSSLHLTSFDSFSLSPEHTHWTGLTSQQSQGLPALHHAQLLQGFWGSNSGLQEQPALYRQSSP